MGLQSEWLDVRGFWQILGKMGQGSNIFINIKLLMSVLMKVKDVISYTPTT